MLQEVCRDRERQHEKPLVDEKPEQRPREGERRRVRLERPLDVPFGIERAQASLDALRMPGMEAHAVGDLGVELPVDLGAGVAPNAFGSVREHGKASSLLVNAASRTSGPKPETRRAQAVA